MEFRETGIEIRARSLGIPECGFPLAQDVCHAAVIPACRSLSKGYRTAEPSSDALIAKL
jgi:hypothetical protein